MLLKGAREIGLSLEQWQMGENDLLRRMIWRRRPGAEAFARRIVAGPGLDGSSQGTVIGPEPPHYRTHYVPITGGRRPSARPGLRPCRSRRPAVPPLDQAQQEGLKAAVQLTLPGLEMGNWSLRQAQEEGSDAVCFRTLRCEPEPQQYPC